MSAVAVVRAVLGVVVYDGTHLLPFLPTFVKAAFLALVLFQLPTFPLSWHFGMFKLWTITSLRIRLIGRKRYIDEWSKWIHQKGTVRFYRHRIAKRATPGQCDFMGHLSNSSYALNADRGRMEWMLSSMGPYLNFGTGAFVALASTHFVYIKEIPTGTKYVMETRISGYGEKWLYGVVEYVMYPSRKGTPSGGKAGEKLVEQVKERFDTESIKPPTVSATTSGSSTPLEKVKAAATLRSSLPREDGGVVACVAVHEACFKIGRITIPPRIAFYYAMQSPDPAAREHARQICLSKDAGKKWLRGGWREEPNADLLGADIGPEGAEGNGDWFRSVDEGMIAMHEGLARAV